MLNYRIIAKRDYKYNQNNLLKIKEYLIIEKNGKKYLVLKIYNNTKSILNNYNFEVVQKDLDGNYIATNNYNESNKNINGNTTFISDFWLEIDDRCEDIHINLQNAVFNNLVFEDGKKYKISKNNGNSYNDIVKQESVKNIPLKYTLLPTIIAALCLISTFLYTYIYKNTHYYFTLDNFEYSFVGDEHNLDSPIVINRYNGNEFNILIPEKLKNHDIIKINDYAFANTNIKNIKFEGNIEISKGSFANCKNLESVSFDKLVNIPENAFLDCSSLKILESKTIEYIDENAFKNCSSLTNISLDGVRYIGNAFNYCENIKYLTLKNDELISINQKAFDNSCSSIIEVKIDALTTPLHDLKIFNPTLEKLYVKDYTLTFGDKTLRQLFGNDKSFLKEFETETLKEITPDFFRNFINLNKISINKLEKLDLGDEAFFNCDSLSQLNIKDKFTSIGENAFCKTNIEFIDASDCISIGNYAFSGCNLLKDIKLNSTTCNLGAGVFENCASLTSLDIPFSINSINDDMFSGCVNLTLLTFNKYSKIESVGKSSFKDCKNLVNIPGITILNKIDVSSFEGCESLTTINLSDDIVDIPDSCFKNCKSLLSVNNILTKNLQSIGVEAFSGCSCLNEVVLSSNIKSIGAKAFSNCDQLKSVIFPNNTNIVEIPERLFLKCSTLETITLSDSINTIGKYAFSDCVSLKTLNIPNSIKYINDSAFKSCIGLKYVTIGDSLETFGINVFDNCSNIIELTVPFVGYNINDKQPLSHLLGNSSNLQKLTITKQKIIPSFFINNQSLIELELRETVEIEDNAFICPKLKIATIPNTVQKIGANIFNDCNTINNLTVPFVGKTIDDIKDISYFIKNPDSLYTLSIDTVSNIDTVQLRNLSNLKSLTINHINQISSTSFTNNYEIEYIDLGNDLTTIPNYAFKHRSKLKEIKIGNNIRVIEKGAFYNCSSLKYIDLPNTLLSIGDEAFNYCENLLSIKIPSSVNKIGKDIFGNCNSLYEVINESRVSNDLFTGYNFSPLQITNNKNDKLKSFEFNNFVFANYNNNWYLTSCSYNNDNKKIVLPSSVQYENNNITYYIKPYLMVNLFFEELTISKDVVNIGEQSFFKCNISNIIFEENSKLNSIGVSAFSYNNITNIDLPEGLEIIATSAFSECKNLFSVSLPSTLKNIEKEAFMYCNSLLEVWNYSPLDIKVESKDYGYVAKNALIVHKNKDEQPLKQINVDNFVFYASEDVCALYKVNQPSSDLILPSVVKDGSKTYFDYILLSNFIEYKHNIKTVYIPKAVTEIKDSCFSSSSNLTTVTIEEGSRLKKIGYSAFVYCNNLRSINLPDSLEIIGEYAFQDCEKLREIYLGKNIKEIQNGAFSNCKSLIQVINNSMFNIEKGSYEFGEVAKNAFEIVHSIADSKIHFKEENNLTFMEYQNKVYLFDLINTNDIVLPYSIVINNKTYNEYGIYSNVFNDVNLNTLTIPNCINEIKPYSFYSSDIKNIIFEENSKVTELPSHAFGFYSLQNIVLPDNLVTIYNDAFNSCSNLSYISLPKTLKTIEGGSFWGCNISVIINNSDLNITVGKKDNGYIAENACYVFNKPLSEPTIKLVENVTINENISVNVLLVNDIPFITKFYSYTNELILPKSITINNKIYDSYYIGAVKNDISNVSTIILNSSVKMIGTSSLIDIQNVLFDGDKNTFESLNYIDFASLGKKVLFYSPCVHDNESWTYNNNIIVTSPMYTDYKIIKQNTCLSEGLITYQCNICKQLVEMKTPIIEHNLNSFCNDCGRTTYKIDKYKMNFDYSNITNSSWYGLGGSLIDFSIFGSLNDNESYSLSHTASYNQSFEFDFFMASQFSKDTFNIYLNDKLINTYSGVVSKTHIKLEMKPQDAIKLTYSKDSSVSFGFDNVAFSDFYCTYK